MVMRPQSARSAALSADLMVRRESRLVPRVRSTNVYRAVAVGRVIAAGRFTIADVADDDCGAAPGSIYQPSRSSDSFPGMYETVEESVWISPCFGVDVKDSLRNGVAVSGELARHQRRFLVRLDNVQLSQREGRRRELGNDQGRASDASHDS